MSTTAPPIGGISDKGKERRKRREEDRKEETKRDITGEEKRRLE